MAPRLSLALVSLSLCAGACTLTINGEDGGTETGDSGADAEASDTNGVTTTTNGEAGEAEEGGITVTTAADAGDGDGDDTNGITVTTAADAGDGDGDSEGGGSGPYSTCGAGGEAPGDWVRYDVDLSWYEVLAPAGDGPFPLVVALHGDEGDPGAAQWNWESTFTNNQDFIVVTPQFHHQDGVDGTSDNGWDNYPDEGETLVRQVLEDVGSRYDVDLNRVYLTGVSAGGWWLGQRGYKMQDIFAAIQFSCGASPLAFGGAYELPTNMACKAPTRFEISTDDFLYTYGDQLRDELLDRGHEVVFSETPCSGHCCGGQAEYGDAALDFFRSRTLCGDLLEGAPGGTCGDFGDFPSP